jgi:hypothetical protein
MLLTEFGRAWINPQFRLTAFKVAIAVGTVLIILNHGAAIVHGEMTMGRWFSALLTYIVPYTVNIHGQWTAQTRQTITTTITASTGDAIAALTEGIEQSNPANNAEMPTNTSDKSS